MSKFADSIITNVKIFTADEANPRAEAIVVRGDRIVYAGSRTEVEEWRFAIGDDVTYVWSGPASGEEPEDWRVLGTATYPAGAVF